MKARDLMAGVFISYRREDSPGHAGRVFDRVRAKFGVDVVFMDVTAIDAGADFVDAIERAVGTCDVLLAIIGPQWIGAADAAGRRRLDNPNDFIRLEISGALKRNVRVVPVLVDGARLPTAQELPEALQPLLRRNAVELRDSRWDADIEQLIASLQRVVTMTDEPLRIEAPPRRWRTMAALAALVVLAVGVGAAVVFYRPRASAPAAVDTPKASVTPGPATAPNVVGRSLADARAILRRAGVEVARVLYRDDRSQAIDLVVLQSDVRASNGNPPAVALTVVARAVVAIRHRPDDADVARGLLGALLASKAADGLAIRTVETTVVRPEAVARVTYSDPALAATAADIAKDANAWLQQTEPGRPLLTASLYPPVVSRTILIGLPDPGGTTSSTASPVLPDVRGLNVAVARRMLTAAGVNAFAYKWSDDGSRTPLEVFDQSEVTGPAGRTAVLQVGAKGTLSLYHLESDAPIVDRLARDLQSHVNAMGILVRPVPQTAVRPTMVGTVASADGLTREAGTIATFASTWLARETGRRMQFKAVTEPMGPRRLTFGLPSLR